jgi:para-aminobenzoate synthetase component 1
VKHETVITPEPSIREIAYGDAALAAARLRHERDLVFLDSAMRHERFGRYSYLACRPFATFKADDGAHWADVAAQISNVLERHRLRHLPGLPPFQGGLCGYVAYEAGRLIEPHVRALTPPPAIPSLWLNAYDCVVAFDHVAERAWIVSTGFPELTPLGRHRRAMERIDEMMERLAGPTPTFAGSPHIDGWRSNFDRPGYEAAVARTIEYILAGDIFQANIAQRFTAEIAPGFDPFAFYRSLRERNPATFAAWLSFGDVRIASSSPERLVSYDGIAAEARPIKGTRRRHPDPNEDAALRQELLASRKDRAENVMIVDLLRNDLSRVCDPGSVDVPVLCGLESYANVHHLVSAITGRLSRGKTAADLLAAVFPGGSITGAPKLRAMEIIGAIERVPRNVYCGSIGFLSFSGHLDFNIAIRTVEFHGGIASFSAGGGITAKSEPRAEYEESRVKAERIFEAFGAAP